MRIPPPVLGLFGEFVWEFTQGVLFGGVKSVVSPAEA